MSARTSGAARCGLLCSLPCLPSPAPSRAEHAGLLQIDFKLARPGLMKNFEGKWRVQPFTQPTLGEVSGQHLAHSRPRWLPAAFDNLHFRAPRRAAGRRCVLDWLVVSCGEVQLAAASPRRNAAEA